MKAEETFKIIIKQEPKYGPTYYSYGLLLAELNRNDEAITQLETALKYMPENTRVYYNLGLLYDAVRKPELAENVIVEGLKQEASNENLLYLLAYHYSQNSELEKAKNIARRLIELYPQNSQYINFYNRLGNRN